MKALLDSFDLQNRDSPGSTRVLGVGRCTCSQITFDH
jgi:hypothetical protein